MPEKMLVTCKLARVLTFSVEFTRVTMFELITFSKVLTVRVVILAPFQTLIVATLAYWILVV